MEEVDPWKLIEKFRQQHKEEIHNVWMPLAQQWREKCEELQQEIDVLKGNKNQAKSNSGKILEALLGGKNG